MELKVPEIEQTLKIIKKIESEENEQFDAKFQLIPGIFSEVQCQRDNKVILYLGAETFVEYTYQEAIDLL
jgi:prefoldin subunit 5